MEVYILIFIAIAIIAAIIHSHAVDGTNTTPDNPASSESDNNAFEFDDDSMFTDPINSWSSLNIHYDDDSNDSISSDDNIGSSFDDD